MVVVGWVRLPTLAVRNEHVLELGAGVGVWPGNVWHQAKKRKNKNKIELYQDPEHEDGLEPHHL